MLSCYFVPRPHYRPVVIFRGIPSSLTIVSSTSDSSAAADLSFAPPKSRHYCSHHLRDTLAPSLQADGSQRPIIGCVAIYCASVFCLLMMYVLIPSNLDSSIASSNDRYSQLPPSRILGCLPVIHHATLCWRILRARSILGVSTHVSALNNNNTYVTALKNVPTPLDPPPPGSKSTTAAPNSSAPYKGCLTLKANNHLSSSSSFPYV